MGNQENRRRKVVVFTSWSKSSAARSMVCPRSCGPYELRTNLCERIWCGTVNCFGDALLLKNLARPKLGQSEPAPSYSKELQPNASFCSATTSWPTASEASERLLEGERPRRVLSTRGARHPPNDERRRGLPDIRRNTSGEDLGMPPISDQRGHMGADSSKRAVSPVVDEDRFQQVMPRRRVKASVGSAKASKLRVVAKPPRKRALFVSRLHPETTSDELSEIVSSALGCQSFSCTKLAARYDTYASFHVIVNEEDFEKLVCPDLWPEGCLFRPFLGRLRVDNERSALNPKPKQGEDSAAPLGS
ncbi:hypothetical protein ISCGN_025828 [Ixodes scapularis]